MTSERVIIFDTTLRDGEQSPGNSMNLEEKLLVADEIKKLFDLYKAGALTKEEYEAQKKKLLAKQ